jgi:hypothetical protein
MGDSSKIFSLIYLSTATVPFSKVDLLELLTKSRKNNSSLGVSGMLLFKDGNFLQVLEGEEKKVRPLYEKIALDTRHKTVIILSMGYCPERSFPDWSMGFQDLRSPDVAKIPGFTVFLDTALTSADLVGDPGKAKKLLLLFKEDKLISKGVAR